jgi:hypothetical protein
MKKPNQPRAPRAYWKNTILSKVLLSLVLLFSAVISNSQENTYEIVEKGTAQDLSVYTQAMDLANFDRLRYKSTRRIIYFTEGVKIELLSGDEVVGKGLEISHEGMLIPNEIYNYEEPTYKVLKSGHIVAEYPIKRK